MSRPIFYCLVFFLLKCYSASEYGNDCNYCNRSSDKSTASALRCRLGSLFSSLLGCLLGCLLLLVSKTYVP